MYYKFGRCANFIAFSKEHRLSLDLAYFSQNNFTSEELKLVNKNNECFYVTKNQTIKVDNVSVTNKNESNFYKRADMLDWNTNLCIHNGILTQNPDPFDLSGFFLPALDDNEVIKTYISTQQFTVNSNKPILSLIKTPIVNLKIKDVIFNNHVFILIKMYNLAWAASFKLYCIKLKK